MAGHSYITAVTWLFGLAFLGLIAAVAWHFRQLPVTALIAAGAKRQAYHEQALAALDHAISAARAEGKPGEAARLDPERAQHVRALRRIAATGEMPNRR